MTKLSTYRFYLPLATNAGLSTESARKQWEAAALDAAGGFTALAFADGAWRNDAGRVFKDRIAPYDVALEPHKLPDLLGAFWRLFPDQEALAFAKLGAAHLETRPGG